MFKMRRRNLWIFGLLFCWHYFGVESVFDGPTTTESDADRNLCPEPVCSCLGGHVDCSKRALKRVPANLPIWTETLELQGNELNGSGALDFPHLPNLHKLDLSNCGLTSLESSVFSNLPNLKSLKANGIRKFDPVNLSTLSELTHLDLSRNHLTSWPSGVKLAKLKKLSLDGNRIAELEAGSFENVANLLVLKVSRNKIRTVDKSAFDSLEKLEFLDLARNRIRGLEALLFKGLKSLQRLRLCKNRIEEIADGAFYNLANLLELEIQNNKLKSVTNGWLYGLVGLETLDLSSNSIRSMEPEGWARVGRLKELDLSSNRLKSLAKSAFTRLQSLETLNLADNKIQTLAPSSLSGLVALKNLDLSSNELSASVEDGASLFRNSLSLKSLSTLVLTQNHLKYLPENAFLAVSRTLTDLDLALNPLISVHRDAFSRLDNLERIRFNTSNLLCDCDIDWLVPWLKERHLDEFQYMKLKCLHPDKFRGRNLTDIKPEHLTCGNSPKPAIVVQPQDTVGLEGENATMECVVRVSQDTSDAVSVTWKRDSERLFAEEDSLEMVNELVEEETASDSSYVQRRLQLRIYRLLDTDAGFYQCIVSNSFGSAYFRKATLNVHVPPKFRTRPQNVTLKSGSNARLECSADGRPTPTIQWKKDSGEDFPAAKERRMHIMSGDDVFFIVNVKAIDSGRYSCFANSPAGNIRADAYITVLDRPIIRRPLLDQTVEVGEMVLLQCLADGSPTPSIRWFYNSQPLTPSERVSLKSENQILVIQNAQLADQGVYACEISNALETLRQNATLAVTARDRSNAKIGPGDGANATSSAVPPPTSSGTGTATVPVQNNVANEAGERGNTENLVAAEMGDFMDIKNPLFLLGLISVLALLCVTLTLLCWLLAIRCRKNRNTSGTVGRTCPPPKTAVPPEDQTKFLVGRSGSVSPIPDAGSVPERLVVLMRGDREEFLPNLYYSAATAEEEELQTSSLDSGVGGDLRRPPTAYLASKRDFLASA